MKRRLAITVAELMEEARRVVQCHSPLEASRLDDAVFVDVRDAADRRREGHVPGSIHVPRTVLEWRVDATAELSNERIADPDLRLVIVCNDGYSSLLAAAGLVRMGFERCGHLEGGHRAWVRAGLPVAFEASDADHHRDPQGISG